MGTSDSKPDAEERTRLSIATKDTIEKRKQEIQQIQRNLVTKTDHPTANVDETLALLRLTDISSKQLNRGGSNLTKSDLVAILIALEPRMKTLKGIDQLNNMPVTELNTLIRSIIYHPKQQSTSLVDGPQNQKQLT